MKITLVRPHMTRRRAADALEPLVFGILAARTPPDVKLAFYDDRIEALPYDEPTDLAALTVETFTAKRAYQIAGEYRARGVPVVMGGFHPTLLPDEAQQQADSVVTGDAEEVWPQIVEDARAGCLRPRYESAALPALDGPLPDRRLFKGKRYAPLNLVQFGRGCRFACDFCSIHAYYGAGLRQRPVQDVAAEIKAANWRYFLLVDDNLFASEDSAAELFHALIPLKIHWACQVSIDVAQNDRLLDLMAKSGCFAVLIGFESLNPANLGLMRKKWAVQHGDYGLAIEQFYRRGIMVCGSFVFGYDHDTPETFEHTLDFALRSKLMLAQFNPLMPMPGTPLYARLHSEGRLIYPRWWLDDCFRYGQSMFHPRGMSAEALSAGCFRLRQQFNTYPSIVRRAAALPNARSPHHVFAFLAANWVSRQEIYNKQWEVLG